MYRIFKRSTALFLSLLMIVNLSAVAATNTDGVDISMYWSENMANESWNNAENNDVNTIFDVAGFEADSEAVRYIKLQNDGKKAYSYVLDATYSGAYSSLAEVVEVYVKEDVTENVSSANMTKIGTLADVFGAGMLSEGKIIPENETATDGYLAVEGEPHWTSPWGEGRPGWHIECSAMANKYLGKTIDIHCGGVDLIFPHHENEIAQSEAANCCDFAHYWMHNGHINVDSKKMSKSLGNFFTVRDAAEKYGYETIRFFMLSSHYRSPINYSADVLESVKSGLERLYTSKNNMLFAIKSAKVQKMTDDEAEALKEYDSFKDLFCEKMDDDLNTADAVSVLFDMARKMNTEPDGRSAEYYTNVLAKFMELCGVLNILANDAPTEIPEDVKALVDARTQARADKNWAEADRIRDELASRGVILEDTKDGVKVLMKK